ncbi:LuxR C-terminal-related transcriptional regulator [Kitasatospora kifunensis]|uniref:DNA-binding CsgD family transcriptional regulator/sugar-specific transcriptional regulator TrmB n=1 Tax=Kitasatospora kifunensis TaxID=58351 RepID=A0A7W7RB01_KITKI|nr:LuxR C-terminal-related transcriptional regulator [Kitasatospora kifunensis]MBB4928705.1 DNA-binding CsgD family transcriptional regulator/sugar-specific transcriptional regulator TrmB [Kitasatospora kifunensis]
MLEALGLTTTAALVYRTMLDRPEYGIAELASHCGLQTGQVHNCLDELTALLLVRASADRPGRLRAVTPEIGLADMIARQEADLAARQAQLAASRAAVTRLVADRAENHPSNGERLLGMDAIQSRLEVLGRAATTEVLGVHPGASQRPEDLSAGRDANRAAIARGVTIKSLYQDTTRNDPHTTTYAHWLLSLGSEVRTAPVLPQRLVIVDRRQALVPIDPADSRKGALHVTEPGIVSALADLFDQAWATAIPLGATRTEDPEAGLSTIERELLRLLGSGQTDETAAQRLGLSTRTVRRHMAAIMERLGATSRFEAGIKAAHLGWL